MYVRAYAPDDLFHPFVGQIPHLLYPNATTIIMLLATIDSARHRRESPGLSSSGESDPTDGFLLAYDEFDPDAEGLREALTSTGNGYLCSRGAAEWEDADAVHYPGTYVHGVYNRETTILGGLPVL